MELYDNKLYMDDVEYVANLNLPWSFLQGKNLVLSGATGMLGSFLVDVLMEKVLHGFEMDIYCLGRSPEKVLTRFSKYQGNNRLHFIPYDVNLPLIQPELGKVDYVLHLASNTHPLQYSTDPIGTITTNIIGLKNMLDFAVAHKAIRFAFASSNEIYGENRGDQELFDEEYCGYIDPNTLRAGYPESKRCGEALCQAYKAQKKLDFVIPRFTRSYGPTMLATDTKAISQFIKKAIAGENIVLKSGGTQMYSYTYMADAVSGLLTILLLGESGAAYNIADVHSDISLKNLAGMIADACNKQVVFEIPDMIEATGYSKATKARLDGKKLQSIGWKPRYDIETGICRTIEILKNLKS